MHFNTAKLSSVIAKAVPHIFTGVGILWFGISAAAAFNTGAKMAKELEQADDFENPPSSSIKDVVKDVLPVMGSFAIGAACVIMSDACHTRMLRATNVAYNNLSKNFQEYKAAVVGALGVEANKIASKAAADGHEPEMDEPPLPDGTYHFYDEFSRNDFVAELADVYEAEAEYNKMFQMLGYVTINQFYDLLDLPHVDRGDDIGFDCGELVDWTGYVWIDFCNEEHIEEDGSKWYSIHINPCPTVDGVIDWDSVMNAYKVAGAIFNH